ncbi:MAG: tRNA uridine-5-carboxymethylaminomethyl(34) synthesis GTPase MnmE [Clostridia bacterium]|nr:tRNA uridine-5-carboxymethylaminomethyl(34) synthesis GTPase MnmE [Clostridia bacterium]
MQLSIINETVFALSTPVGGAIAVIRASGPDSRAALSRIFTGNIEAGKLVFGRIINENRVLDESMAVFFRAPSSYTGEDMFELHLHGSYAVVSAVSELLISIGLRRAEPGEFTKRAFLNGKLDLVQADAVMDLINSETERSAGAALDQLQGGLSRRIGEIETKLIDLASELAAAMDYPEEMEDEALSSVPEVLSPVIAELSLLVENGRSARILREGAKLVILGLPNAGKSSLMNALLGSERAIVTDIAGTTRDTLEEKLNILGVPVRLVDTAGLRENADSPVEMIGIDRANSEAASAECLLFIFDGAFGTPQPEEIALLKKAEGRSAVFAVNKCDISFENCGKYEAALKKELDSLALSPDTAIISTKTGEGLDALKKLLASKLGASENRAIVTNSRHIERLGFAKSELTAALNENSTDLISVYLSSALAALSEITGREFSEELLDSIFTKFCVGK